MFLQYYGLHEQPFGMTPDPRFLYLSASHREALASLIYGIETGRGFVGLIAEPGMGKTTVLFQLMEQLRNSARTVFLFQTQANTREFLSNLIADLGLDPGDRDVSSLQRMLNEILIQEAQRGRQFVLIIDEAQNLDDTVLESVRMLSNFETSRSKLMQIVLAGQPALAEKLARPQLEQLRQRISIICRFTQFTREEVAEYIQHRLKTAGYEGAQLFTPEALSMIAERSEGIPRNINNLCFNALSLAYAEGQKKITAMMVAEVIGDLELDRPGSGRANPNVRHSEVETRPAGLESITLDGEHHDTGRVQLRGGRRLAPPRYRVEGRRRRAGRSPHWLFWAVTVLTVVLATEIFWAYLPASNPSHSFTQLFDNTIGQAKEAATKYNLLQTSSSPGSSEPQTTVIHSNAGSTNQPQGAGSAQLVDSAKAVKESAGPSGSPGEETVSPADSVTALPAAAEPASTPGQTKGMEQDPSSSVDLPASTQVAKGTLVIESNTDGGTITIDGRTDPNWQTPHMFTLPQGTYRVAVSQPGYSTWFRDVRVTPGRKRWITADLHPPQGVIVIDTDPPGMQVFIDGKSYGPSEVETSLSAGSHTYRVVPPNGERPVEGKFVLKAGDILTRTIRWFRSTGQPSAQNRPVTPGSQSKDNSLKGREQS